MKAMKADAMASRPGCKQRRRCRRRPQQNAILFGRLLPNKRPTGVNLLYYCSVLVSGSRDFERTVQHLRPRTRSCAVY